MSTNPASADTKTTPAELHTTLCKIVAVVTNPDYDPVEAVDEIATLLIQSGWGPVPPEAVAEAWDSGWGSVVEAVRPFVPSVADAVPIAPHAGAATVKAEPDEGA